MRKSALFGLPFAAAFLAAVAADDGGSPLPKEPSNLDFESPLEEGWTTKFEGKAEFDATLRKSGARSLRISGPATRIPVERALSQGFDALPFRGKRVQVSAWIRSGDSRIGVFVSSNGIQDADSKGRLPDPKAEEEGWKRVAARIDVPYDADEVSIGARIYLAADKPVWIDDVRFEVCPEGTPLFDPTLLRADFANLDFERAGEGDLPGDWTWEVGEVGDPMDDDYEASDYRFVRDSGSRVSGQSCALIEYVGGAAGGCWVRQVAGAARWRGKKIRFSVYLRWDGLAKIPPEGPFLEVRSQLESLGTAELEWGKSEFSAWRRAEFVLPVPEEAETILLGFHLERGKMWVDAAEVRAVE
jgi:hypothetical protein